MFFAFADIQAPILQSQSRHYYHYHLHQKGVPDEHAFTSTDQVGQDDVWEKGAHPANRVYALTSASTRESSQIAHKQHPGAFRSGCQAKVALELGHRVDGRHDGTVKSGVARADDDHSSRKEKLDVPERSQRRSRVDLSSQLHSRRSLFGRHVPKVHLTETDTGLLHLEELVVILSVIAVRHLERRCLVGRHVVESEDNLSIHCAYIEWSGPYAENRCPLIAKAKPNPTHHIVRS